MLQGDFNIKVYNPIPVLLNIFILSLRLEHVPILAPIPLRVVPISLHRVLKRLLDAPLQ